MIVPTKVEPLPRVADEPTFQKTLQMLAPLMSSIRLPDPVTRVLDAWKTQTDAAPPSRVRVLPDERSSAPPE